VGVTGGRVDGDEGEPRQPTAVPAQLVEQAHLDGLPLRALGTTKCRGDDRLNRLDVARLLAAYQHARSLSARPSQLTARLLR
jgi:hypothetical protein